VPIIATLSAAVTFLSYEEKEIDKELFVIPNDYNRTNIQLDFEFDKAEQDVNVVLEENEAQMK
jgi:hypothetical protein